ncbi:MAG: FtsQ-type POTRA domain-containing protein [Ruminococcaceae bacterium]|nr:FtsQ-type POTRA domain-containing protein [Oscillospiraceae bacterium]
MQTKNRNNMRVTGKAPQQKNQRIRKESDVQIQYTPAKPFNRNRFLLHLATALAVALALVLVMSIFFKAEQVLVSGAEKYTPWEIKEAAGIQSGDALLSLSEAKITAKIRTALPYVGDVRVGIKLPDTVNIEITELDVVYAAEDANGAWWLLDATGRVVDSTDGATAKDYTRIVGVQIQSATVGEQAVAAEPEIPAETNTETGPTIATLPKVPAADRLNAAVQILTTLEKNGVMGTVDSVDVSELGELTLNYGDRYHVILGDTSRMEYKIGAMKASIQKMGQYQSGYLDVSFTIWPDEVRYRPFDETKN